MSNLESFYSEASGLISKFDMFVEAHALQGLAVSDHIGFKCASKDIFEHMREMLEPESHFIYQSFISRRRIAIIKLKEPIETNLGPISVLELSDQKPDGSQSTGFDHIEFYPTSDYDSLIEKLQGQGAALEKVERPHHTTYDINLDAGHKLKVTREPLIEKIRRDEMV